MTIRNFKISPIINLLRYTWRFSTNKKRVILFSAMAFFAAIIFNLEPLVIGRIFNVVQFDQGDPELLAHIMQGLGLLLLIEFVSQIFHAISRVIEQKNAFLVKKEYLQDTFKKTIDLPVSWHKDHHSGDTIDKVNKAANNLQHFASHIFILISNAIRVTTSLIVLAVFDWRILVIASFVGVIAFWTIIKIDKILIRGYRKIFRAENFLASGVHDYVSNIITVLTLRLKPKAFSMIEKRAMKAYPVFKKNTKLNEAKWFLISMYITVMIAAVLFVNAYTEYKNTGLIVIGTLFILYRYLSNIGHTFYNFAYEYSEIVRKNETINEANKIVKDYDKLVKDRKGPEEKPEKVISDAWQTVKISKLNFSYDANLETKQDLSNLSQVSICFKKGSKIALVGESGSGKSTLLSLLRGLYVPDKGKVFVDGKRVQLSFLKDKTLLIPQDPELFNATIRENLTMGKKRAGEEGLDWALRLSRFDKVAKGLPKGLETNVLEKGVSLSGGEKQRLALARGILVAKEHDLILLDEPTSSVDSENELAIYQTLFEEFSDKTIISAVHRLHLLKNFDYVYYFRKGKIIAEGTFMTLLEDDDFQRLWRSYGGEGEVV